MNEKVENSRKEKEHMIRMEQRQNERTEKIKQMELEETQRGKETNRKILQNVRH